MTKPNQPSKSFAAIKHIALLLTLMLAFAAPAFAGQKKQVAQAETSAPVAASTKKRTEASGLKDWHLTAEAVVTVPMDVGGRVMIEMPGRLRLSSSLGVLPTSFVGLINAGMVGAGVYSQGVGAALESSLGDSLVWRIHAEWRPFADAGFYFGGGYGLVTFNGNINVGAVASVSGANIPAQYQNALRFNLNSTLHMLNAEIGWEWTVLRFVNIRLAAGFMGTVGSNTTITVQGDSSIPASAKAEAQTQANSAAAFLDTTYQSYVFSPYVSLSTGIRFF